VESEFDDRAKIPVIVRKLEKKHLDRSSTLTFLAVRDSIRAVYF